MKDLTPEKMRCTFGGCPSIHELEDGRLAVTGVVAVNTGNGGIAPGDREQTVIITRELLANVDGWRPIDTAPKDGTKIDLLIHHSGFRPIRMTDCYWGEDPYGEMSWITGANTEHLGRFDKITHWMLSPALPPAST